MKAVTVEPGIADSVRFEEVPEPDESTGSILVEAVAVGLCGTDVEIASGEYGWAPPGRKRLILGHESLGRVVDPGPDRSVKAGDLIVGIVRRPDPVPCPNCAVGEWDMCRNGQYTERGIKEIDGFMSERWRIEPGYFTKVDPSLGLLAVLLEPTTVVAKAWELVAGMRARAFWEPRQALVTGAGPIGMLAAMIGVRAGLDVHVLDRVTEGAKPQLVHDVGATYHSGAVTDVGFQPDIVIECTGVGSVIVDAIRVVGSGGVVCLTGVGSGGQASGLSPADVAKALVLQNNVILGSVNANRRHFYKAAEALAAADRAWLERLITRRVPPKDIAEALQARARRHQGRRGLRSLMMAGEPQRGGAAVACTAEQTQLGEGVRWDDRRSEVLRVDIVAGRVYRDRVQDDGALASVRVYELPWTVGMIAPIEGDGGWLLGAGRGFVYLAPDGTHRTIAEVSPAGTRMNDGASDPQGRFWGGTLADDHHAGGGALYRLDQNGRTEQMLDGLTIPNGVGWSPDGRTMYLVDSGPRVVHAFAFDADRGTISGVGC